MDFKNSLQIRHVKGLVYYFRTTETREVPYLMRRVPLSLDLKRYILSKT